MLAFLFAVFLLLYLASVVLLTALIKPPRAAGEPLRAAPEPPGLAARRGLQLCIASTKGATLHGVGFLEGYGVSVRMLRDLRVYEGSGALETLPLHLIALLFQLHQHGAVRGAEAMALLYHGRSLTAAEALYFALVDGVPDPTVVAFVDRRRD